MFFLKPIKKAISILNVKGMKEANLVTNYNIYKNGEKSMGPASTFWNERGTQLLEEKMVLLVGLLNLMTSAANPNLAWRPYCQSGARTSVWVPPAYVSTVKKHLK